MLHRAGKASIRRRPVNSALGRTEATMSSDAPDHEAHAVPLFAALGRFVVTFERVCASLRGCIHLAFRSEGLDNQLLAQVVVNGKQAAALCEIFGALTAELRVLDADDRTAIAGVLKRVRDLTTIRNNLLHAEWHTNFDYEGATEEFIPLALRHGSDQSKGAYSKALDVTEASLLEHVHEARELLVLLSRVGTCLGQPTHKVSVLLSRPLA